MNYYLCNNSLDSSTTDVLSHYAVVPRRYRGIQSTVAALLCFCVNDFDVKILPKHNTRSSKPIIRTNNLALIPLLGNHWGRHHMRSGRTRKQKSPIPKKMFVVVRRLVRKNLQNTKLRIEIVLPREIVYPCFLADP